MFYEHQLCLLLLTISTFTFVKDYIISSFISCMVLFNHFTALSHLPCAGQTKGVTLMLCLIPKAVVITISD